MEEETHVTLNESTISMEETHETQNESTIATQHTHEAQNESTIVTKKTHETQNESTTASPPLKKPKISTSDSEPESNATPSAPRRYKRRKVAILFAYCGYGYQGMQKNPGARTIEGDFEEALYRIGAVLESDRNAPRRYDWARAARTDKGVSAAGQVVSGRFIVDPPGFIDRLNDELNDQIKVFGYKRVTGSFNAKKFCDRRRYIYLIPVFALDPTAHPDREAVVASLGSDNVLVKCLECSERGRKIPKEFNEEIKSEICENNDEKNSIGENNLELELGSNMEERSNLCDEKTNLGENNGELLTSKNSVFCYGDTEKERFNKILKNYEGTHNFHNFTTRTKAEDPSAKRYIISFNANSVVNLEGIDFVRCEVIGQSFMLHQIRKMVGLAVAIMRNCAPESLMKVAFRKDVRINVPTAPEVGLFLDECMFSSYNKKWKSSHEEVSMKDYEQQSEEFKMKYIFSHIASMEHKEGAVALWLHSLNKRNYPDFDFTLKEQKEELKEPKDELKEQNEELKEEKLGEGKLKERLKEELKEEKLREGELEEVNEELKETKEELNEEKLGEEMKE